MNGKKIISLILLLSLVFSLSTFQITFAEENAAQEVSVYQNEIEFLKKIKVIDDEFDSSKKITKAELAKIAVKVLHPEVDFSVSGENATFIFNDVPEEHEYYSYIKACKDLKIINGDFNGNFNPESKVTITDVITVMSNALGYTVYANAMGGYPSGYYVIATSTGLLDGVKMSYSTMATGDIMAKLIYNSLFADISGVESVSSDGINIKLEEDSNLLAERLGIYEYDAIVYDNGISALDGNSINDPERVVIKEYKTNDLYSAYVNDTDIASYLGYRVKVFVRNNKEMARNEVVHVALNKRVKTLSIFADTVINANGDYIEYEEDDNDLDAKKVKFGKIRPTLIFNGIRIKDKGLEEIIPKDGILTFIDNDGDNNYDAVEVLSFNYEKGLNNVPARNIIVDSILTINGQRYISCMLNPLKSLDLADENIMYAFTAASEKKSIYEIGTYDVISIAEAPELIDGKTFYFLTVASNFVSGKLDGMVDGSKLEVNGEAYAVSSGLTSIKTGYLKNVKVGEEINLCIDITGKIAYSVSNEYGSKNYAYFINMKENTVPENYLVLKIFTKDGEIKTYNVSSKVKIDGVACTTVKEQKEALTRRDLSTAKETFDKGISRPIIFEENSKGEIIRIDTDTPNLKVSNRSDLYSTHTTIPYDVEEVDDVNALKAGFRGLRHIDYKRYGSAEGKFFITGETVILAVPDIDTYGMKDVVNFVPGTVKPLYDARDAAQVVNERAVELYSLPVTDENYKVYKQSDMNSTYRYDMQAYDIDENTGIAGLVVLRGRNDVYSTIDETTKQNPMYVFLRTTDVYDPESGTNIKKVYYTKDGKTELSATIDTNECFFAFKYLIEGCDKDYTMYNTEVKPLRAGDLIRIRVNDGKIEYIDRVIAVAKDVKSYYSMMVSPGNVSYYYTDRNVSKSSSVEGEDYGMPFDVTDYRASISSSLSVLYAPVKKVSGNTLQLMIPYTATAPSTAEPNLGEISTINLSDPSTYTYQYINAAGLITTVDISEDGQSVKVKNGSLSDIKTITETGSIDGASMIYAKLSYHNVTELFIINNLDKIPLGEKWWVEK